MLIQSFIGGIAVGSVYALIALALALIYKGAQLLNLAQGELVTIAAYFSLALITQLNLPYLSALIPAIVFAGIFAFIVERIVIRPLIGLEEWPILLATWGVSIIIRGLIGLIWGHAPRPLPSPFTQQHIRWGTYAISGQELVIIVFSVFMLFVFYMFFNKSKAGLAMKVAADNHLGASLCGVNVSKINGLTWIISGMVSAIAGIMVAPIYFLKVDMGFELLLAAFSAAVLGGFGSIRGAIIGGYLLGVMQTITGGFMPAAVKSSIPFIILILVLVVRPRGLFGKEIVEKK